MAINRQRIRQCLSEFDFKTLFIEELGWDRFARPSIEVPLENGSYRLRPLAEKGGVTAFECQATDGNRFPDKTDRRKIEKVVKEHHFEHLIVFTDPDRTTCTWMWVKRQPGKQARMREKSFVRSQSGERIVQALETIAFELSELDGEGTVPVTRVTSKLQRAFDVERVTKRFYDEFKTEHSSFLKFLKGIPIKGDAEWYASVMLNRLMFIYFIQKKGFLDSDSYYLTEKLKASSGKDQFYKRFLIRLFFEGFAQDEKERSKETNALLGKVPYLNGGLFMPHQLEQAHGKDIKIVDAAFKRLFAFFEKYEWHLDDRPTKADNEINPDVLGYIFEKYINQKQMGAYYTKEDITDYICKNTIIPFLFDKLASQGPIGNKAVNPFPMQEVEPYIYDCLKHGMDKTLPDDIAAGIDEVPKRTGWNKAAPPDYALPTEIWREVVARRQRVDQIRTDFANGKIGSINDLITYNLDIRRFAEDWARGLTDPAVLRLFYFEVLTKVTVLDPACGSGAFLFAAMNILEPLYEICLDRMAHLAANPPKKQSGDTKHAISLFEAELARIAKHANRRYFVYKSIVVNNLYGVDIMEEAVEICKLRLFLKLVALVDDPRKIEPLPDIDFNIKAGNTLVGYASSREIEEAVKKRAERYPLLDADPDNLMEQVKAVDRKLATFREAQTTLGVSARVLAKAKAEALGSLRQVEDMLNADLAGDYGHTTDKRIKAFVTSHQPFHWYINYYDIMSHGGFDAVVGNPPYMELRAIRTYTLPQMRCSSTRNLYPLFLERAIRLRQPQGRQGVIVPVSSISTEGYSPLQDILLAESLHYSSYDDRPSRLFAGIEHIRLSIHLSHASASPSYYSTRYSKWSGAERQNLFPKLEYAPAAMGDIEGSCPKLSHPLEPLILDALRKQECRLSKFYAASDKATIYYSRKVGYFLQVLDFAPRVLDGNGNLRPPSEFKLLRFNSREHAELALCCLNSSLFYWFVTVFSDCRHLNKREVDSFFIDLDGLAAHRVSTRLCSLAKELMEDLQKHSVDRAMSFKHDRLTVQCLIPKHSKEIIDKIDRHLGDYYGFSGADVDFLINYEIKYRIGGERNG